MSGVFIIFIFLSWIYLFLRNHLVWKIRNRFIDFFYLDDPEGYKAGRIFFEYVPSYDEMLWKFWVWPLSRFYPAYHEHIKKGKHK